MGVVLLAVGWLIVAVLGLVALLRLVAWDSLQPLVVLDALLWSSTCRPGWWLPVR